MEQLKRFLVQHCGTQLSIVRTYYRTYLQDIINKSLKQFGGTWSDLTGLKSDDDQLETVRIKLRASY
jgi:hypothetical protein